MGRAWVAVLAAAAVVAAVWLLVSAAPAPPEGRAQVHVEVLGPDGEVLATGDVLASPPTALQALLAVTDGKLDVDVRRHGVAGGCGAYVAAVGGHQEQGVDGWLYDVKPSGQAWQVRPPDAADCHRLEDGATVRWYYGTY